MGTYVCMCVSDGVYENMHVRVCVCVRVRAQLTAMGVSLTDLSVPKNILAHTEGGGCLGDYNVKHTHTQVSSTPHWVCWRAHNICVFVCVCVW